MSNYLDNLVARHLDKPTVVRPRLTSLFEPQRTVAWKSAAGNVFGPFESDSFSEESSDAGLIDSRRAAEAAFHSDPHGSRTQASLDETLTTVWRGRQRIPPTSISGPGPTEPADLFVPVPVQPGPPRTQTATAKPANRQSTTADALSPLSNKNDAAPGRDRLPSSEPVTTRIEPPVAQDLRKQVLSLDLRQTRLETSPVDSTGKGIVVKPRIFPRDESRNAMNDPTSQAYKNDRQPEPTINVTIGRVEVRATPPATTPRKQSSAAPVMGLDEYLRKRSMGDGR